MQYRSVFSFIIENVPADLDILPKLDGVGEMLCIGVPIGMLEIGSELPKLGSVFKPDFIISPTRRFRGVRM